MSISTSRKQVSFLSNLFPGHLHDFTIFKKLFAEFDFSGFRIHVDLGFVGIQKAVQTKAVVQSLVISVFGGGPKLGDV